MGLLRFLGIEKYLKKVKAYVDEENVKDRAYTDKKVSENKTATPDWDAESWEAGYIKNRTHRLSGLTILTKDGDTEYGMLETQYLKIQDELFSISRGETVILKQGPHISVTYENGQLTLNDPEDAAESFGGVVVAAGIHQISEHYIPDTIARTSQIPEGDTTKWNSVDRETLMNELDTPITSADMERIGFNLEYLAQPQKYLKGIVIEDNYSDLGNAYLALTYFVMRDGIADHICFGHINRNDSGAELEISKDSEERWMIRYIEA